MPEDQAPLLGGHAAPGAESVARPPLPLSQDMAAFGPRPASGEDVAMSVDIDAIHDQLARDIPTLRREMDALLTRVRTPALA
jgi:hypothetical protein